MDSDIKSDDFATLLLKSIDATYSAENNELRFDPAQTGDADALQNRRAYGAQAALCGDSREKRHSSGTS